MTGLGVSAITIGTEFNISCASLSMMFTKQMKFKIIVIGRRS